MAAVGIDHQAIALLRHESGSFNLQVVAPDRQTREGVDAVLVGHGLEVNALQRVRQRQHDAGNDRAAGVLERA